MTNNFKEQLKASDSPEVTQLVWRALRSVFGASEMIPEGNLTEQFKGIDRYYKGFKIEHKMRTIYYPDILFEIVSNDNTNTLGWAEKKLDCDVFVYGWLPINTVYVFEYKDFKKTWEMNKKVWISKYNRKVAKNDTYNTISIPVPITELLNKIDQYWLYEGSCMTGHTNSG